LPAFGTKWLRVPSVLHSSRLRSGSRAPAWTPLTSDATTTRQVCVRRLFRDFHFRTRLPVSLQPVAILRSCELHFPLWEPSSPRKAQLLPCRGNRKRANPVFSLRSPNN